ncbi:MAG: TonB family protein [Leptolyngbya sp.]|nr:TonB family protein [Candidatus Melainabacteria bacterium]
MVKADRSLSVSRVLLLGTLTIFLIPQCAPSVLAVDTAKAAPHVLHDSEMTVNPWYHDEKVLKAFRENVADAKNYIHREPNDPTNYLTRARAYLQLMLPKEALSDANAALALKPKDKRDLSDAHCYKGEALLQLKQYKSALNDLSNACALDAESGEAFYFCGMAKEMIGQLPEAIKDYEMARSLSFSPKGSQVDFSAFMNQLERKIKSNWHPPKSDMTKKAIVAFYVIRNGNISHIRIVKTSGAAVMDAGAISAVQQSSPFEPLPKGSLREVDIRFTFDYNAPGVGRSASAGPVTFLEKVMEKWDNAENAALKKLTDAKKGNDETAVYDAELKLAKIYTDRGRYPAAIDLYQSALHVLEKKPDKQLLYGKTLGHLAMVYSLQGKNAEAETEFKKSLGIVDKDSGYPSDPEVVEILKEYAKVLYKTKKVDEANKIYARLKK